MRKATRQREAILNTLQSTSSHPTADWIYDEVRKKMPDISKGTVYRNLQVLFEDGLISVLNINGARNRYEVKQKYHYHFKCNNCERVFDLDEPVDKDIDQRISQKTGFMVSGHQTEFRGLCRDCRTL